MPRVDRFTQVQFKWGEDRPHPKEGEIHVIYLGEEPVAVGHLIHPSVRYMGGCKSHFYIREDGLIEWLP